MNKCKIDVYIDRLNLNILKVLRQSLYIFTVNLRKKKEVLILYLNIIEFNLIHKFCFPVNKLRILYKIT